MLCKVLLVLIVLDLMACYIYCSIRKKRECTKSMTNGSAPQIDASNRPESKSDPQKMVSSLYKWYRHVMDCILRPTLFIVGYIPSHHIRDFLYKYIFKVDMHRKSVIYYGAELRAPWNISIGEGSIVGDRVVLDGRNGIRIGANVNISTGASIWTMQHDVNDPYFGTEGGTVYIEDRVWVSCNTVILPEVIVREGSVIAAGAVVTKDTEAYSINGGLPSKKLGDRSRDLKYNFDGSYMHFL